MTTYKNKLLFILLTYLTGCVCEEQTKCISSKLKNLKLSTDVIESSIPVEYTCPRKLDPRTFTVCCNDKDCCEATFLSVSDDWLLMITAILVISTCMVLTVLVVICCFWSKCPLYNTCRANYNTSNVIVYSLGKDDPTPLMPAEAYKGGPYHPCTVKIKKMQEV